MKRFEEFWPSYLSEHSHPKNRRLHFIGTLIVQLILFYVFATADFKALWLVPIFGYGFSWAGHFLVEKNRPICLKHPIWCVMGDFKMFYSILGKKL